MTSPLFIATPETLPRTVTQTQQLTLPPDLFRHAVRSMRLGEGDELTLSDGLGMRVTATLEDPENGVVRVTATEVEEKPRVRISLVQALAKGGRDEMAIEESTEIGVDGVIPWQADRSIVQWSGAKAAKAQRKWTQILTAATEQSRRAWIPQLSDVMSTKQLVRFCEKETAEGNLFVVLHQDATKTWEGIEQAAEQLTDGKTVYFVVGPEGGISDREIEQLTQAGAEVVVIGRTILRASTAGPVAVALLSRTLGRFS